MKFVAHFYEFLPSNTIERDEGEAAEESGKMGASINILACWLLAVGC